MNRRHFLSFSAALVPVAAIGLLPLRNSATAAPAIMRIEKTEAQWRELLAPARFDVLRKEATEPPHSSELNHEKRKGQFVCAGCQLPLFASAAKYDSGTGWPSFFEPLPQSLGTKLDFKVILPRTEYHCARCEGHQGHIFNDGPQPTGKRYCNNGLALEFIPS